MGELNVRPLGAIHSTAVASSSVDFFSTALSPDSKSGSISLVTVGVSVAAACKVGLRISNGTTTVGAFWFNAGVDLTADCLYTFYYPAVMGYTYNLRHDDAGSITVNSCVVQEIIGPSA